MKKITFKISAFVLVAMFAFSAKAQVELEKVYTLRNLNTGEYLRSDAANRGVEPVVGLPAVPFADDDLKYNFLFRQVDVTIDGASKTVYNIVSVVKGALRGAGAGAGDKVFNTSKNPTTTDSDKVFQLVEVSTSPLRYRFVFGANAISDNSKYMTRVDGTTTPDDTNDVDVIIGTTAVDDSSLWQLDESGIVLNVEKFDASSIVINNPVKNLLTIKGLDADITKVSVYNLLGGNMLTKNLQGETSTNLDVSNLVSGMYIVKLEGANGAMTKKIIKQ